MPDYAIRISEPDFQYTSDTIFYADDEMMIYRDGPFVRAVESQGDLIQTIRCPSNFKHFESIDLGHMVLLMFSGEQIILLNKRNTESSVHGLAVHKFGACITPLLLSKNTQGVVFGTRSRGYVQFVHYDYIAQKRVSQTSSWKMANITDFTVKDDKLYALLDNSFMICSNIQNCEPLWTRFETGKISPQIIPDGDEIFYACQGVLKRRNPEVESIKIPLVKVHTVEAKFGDKVILTAMGGKSLCGFDVVTRETKWEIRSNLAILQTLPIRILTEGKLRDALAIRTKNHITIVDCSKGKTVYHNQFDNLTRIRKTGSHLLLHKYNGSTGVIKGERV